MERAWFKFNLSYPLTLLSAVVCLIVSISALTELYTYYRLQTRVPIFLEEGKVVKKSSSAYAIRLQYHFEWKEHEYHGNALLPPPYHLNRLSAQKYLAALFHPGLQHEPQEGWEAWIDPYQPHISCLKKFFPTKKIIYLLITLGIACYFGWIETHSRIRAPIN